MSNAEVRRPRVTLADVCLAIAEGRLKATRECDGHYAVSRQDFLRYVARLGACHAQSEQSVASN